MDSGSRGNHMFINTSINTISGGTFVNSIPTEKPALEKLSSAAAHGALHDAPARSDTSRCHQHTRINILDHLEHWAEGIRDEGTSIFWLNGGAGAGKSAIMQTLAERCFARRLVLGSFFFSRSDPTRKSAEVLIPTLAYQFAQLFPSALKVLEAVMNDDPLIFKKSFRAQLLSLFVKPLQHLVQLGHISDSPQTLRVFLIDGLDECDDTLQQQAIVHAIASLCHEHCIPIKCLIASRLDNEISTSFELYERENHVLGTISLGQDPHAEADIRYFLEDEFLRIRSQHRFRKMIPSDWPNIYDINRMVRKSSSHFIYASTSMKYIWSAMESPVRSLQVVLGLEVTRTTPPFFELDALYHHVLGSAAHLEKVLQILAHCVYADLPSSVEMICLMLECSDDDLTICLGDVMPLVALSSKPKWLQVEIVVELLHASLGDFLGDPSRSDSLYINEENYLSSTLERCFQLLDIKIRTADLYRKLGGISFYNSLKDQIIRTVRTTTSLVETQEALGRHSLLDFYQWQLSFGDELPMIWRLLHFFQLFLAVNSFNTSKGVTLFTSSADDFLDILHTHASVKNMPLVGAIFTLIFVGYPARALLQTLALYLGVTKSWRVELPNEEAEIARLGHTVNIAPGRTAMATEAILWQLLDGKGKSDYSPSLAHFGLQMNNTLLDAVIWLLPKAGISYNSAPFSKQTMSLCMRDISRDHDTSDISLLEKSPDKNNAQAQGTELQDLDRRIENGDVSGLIEKSYMFLINNQN